ncbi:MAG: amidohydrolase [Pseudomonadales bacterium]
MKLLRPAIQYHPYPAMLVALLVSLLISTVSNADDIEKAVAKDYDAHLGELFTHFHRNPELSNLETKTAERLALELEQVGFTVHKKVGGKTGIVALLNNGEGPMVMMRADMDGLPVQEKTGLKYASTAQQEDWDGNLVYTMHACGHDVHITSLVGTARRMAAMKDQWSGTLMLIGQPAEERVRGAREMMDDKLWKRFGKPDYAMAFHVSSGVRAGKIAATEGSPYSGADTVDIIVHGVGAHGASPHAGKDPVVIGSQIVLALQTIVSREIAPKEPSVITVGSFHSGTKHNIISDRAHLQLTVRSDRKKTRDQLLEAIERVAVNVGRAAGMPEDKLPEVIVSDESVPPTVNDKPLSKRLIALWGDKMGTDIFDNTSENQGMGAEDFGFFTTDPYIPSHYFAVGGTPEAAFEVAAEGGTPIPSHHSPLFKILPEPAVRTGVEATVHALLELLQDK